ncbi:MAG: hypothetical protein Q3996_01135 [Candidatus Saccharibacteria bacterium]|nr:hypothetical protein [Candidatus Saccharibacteria bacterium]
MDFKIILFIVFILLIGIGLFALLTLKQKTIVLNKEKYRSLWLEIENGLIPDQQQSFQMTVLNADKLLGQALEELGVRGTTMGERMKTFGSGFSNQNQIWQAHKIRNKIAHEANVQLNFKQVQALLKCFKQALKDVGAI